jgi:phosphatidylglycerophosphate synthase
MILEIISAIVILGITILFLNPGHLAMPDNVVSMMIVLLIISFLTFAAFILRERAKDERETMHVMAAGRISYLVGVGALILGIILQALKHEIDPWLVIALCAMIFSKLISRIYSHFKM